MVGALEGRVERGGRVLRCVRAHRTEPARWQPRGCLRAGCGRLEGRAPSKMFQREQTALRQLVPMCFLLYHSHAILQGTQLFFFEHVFPEYIQHQKFLLIF